MDRAVRRLAAGWAVAAAVALTVVAGASSGAALAGSAATNTDAKGSPLAARGGKACAGCFAVVEASGVPVRGRGLGGVTRLATGTYDVRFGHPIATCAWTATQAMPGFASSLPDGGQVTLAGRAGTNNGVFVQTFDAAGVPTDRPFHLLISC